VALAEYNSPKRPGTITLQGHVRDRAGHWQPVWKMRAGDTLAITDSVDLSGRPRLIHETNYSADGYSVTVGVDGPPNRLDAILDRQATALAAHNIT
jgi:hypothetical protein